MKPQSIAPYAMLLAGISLGMALTVIYASMPLVFSQTQINITRSEINVTVNNCTQPITIINNKPEWLQIIETFHFDKSYSENGYNCRFYSAELATILKNMGYNATTVQGYCMGRETGHAWIRITIDYEPQSGEEIGGVCYE